MLFVIDRVWKPYLIEKGQAKNKKGNIKWDKIATS